MFCENKLSFKNAKLINKANLYTSFYLQTNKTKVLK